MESFGTLIIIEFSFVSSQKSANLLKKGKSARSAGSFVQVSTIKVFERPVFIVGVNFSIDARKFGLIYQRFAPKLFSMKNCVDNFSNTQKIFANFFITFM